MAALRSPKVTEFPQPYYGYRDVVTLPVKHRASPIFPAIVVGAALVVAVVLMAKRASSPTKPVKFPVLPVPTKPSKPDDMEKRFADSDKHERDIERTYPDRSEAASWPSKK